MCTIVYNTVTGEWYTVLHWVSKRTHTMWYTSVDWQLKKGIINDEFEKSKKTSTATIDSDSNENISKEKAQPVHFTFSQISLQFTR